jgi:predicted RNase H-like HicB family nuclease
MRYQLGVEDMEGEHWIAWVFELLGCVSTGKTRAEAVARAGASIAAYQQWLGEHCSERAFEDPYIDIHVAEIYEAVETEPGYIANAFFVDDHIPLAKEDVTFVRCLLEGTRADLLTRVARISPEKRAEPIPGDRFGSIDGILGHLGEAEWWYLDRLELAFPKSELPDEPLERLERVRAHLMLHLDELIGDERVTWPNREGWSARKLIRRTVWHERDHTQHIAKLLQTSEFSQNSEV